MKTRKIILGLFTLLLGVVICGLFNVDPFIGMTGITMAITPIVGGLKSSNELRDEKGAIWDKAQAIIATAKEEKRVLTDDQTSEYDGYLEKMKTLGLEIKRAETHEKTVIEMAGEQQRKKTEKGEQREIDKIKNNFNLVKAIRSQLPNQKLEGLELEMHQEAVKEARAMGKEVEGVGIPGIILHEKRDQTAGTTTEGGFTVPTVQQGFIEPLKAKMQLASLGAQFLTGLTSKIDIPAATALTATWEGEKDANVEKDSVFSKISLDPKRLGGYTDISKQLIFQSSIDVEKFIKNELLSAIAIAVETAAINGSGSDPIPEGILNTSGIGSVAGGTNGLAATWGNIINLEREVAVDNADIGSLGYFTNPKVRAKLKQTALDSGSGLFVWPKDDNMLNGYRAAISTLVPSDLDKGTSTGVCSAIIFGNFNDLMIGQFGGMDLVVDPYTQAGSSLLRIVANSWWDVAVRRAVSFAAMADALTT